MGRVDKSDYKYVGFRQIDGWNITCRNDKWEDLILDLERADKGILKHKNDINFDDIDIEDEPSHVDNIDEPTTPKPLICDVCGSKATLQEGIGKNGNPYKLKKCSNDYKHNAFLD